MSLRQLTAEQIEHVRDVRATAPQSIADAWAARTRRPIMRGDNKLMIVACDHPARGSLSVGGQAGVMADRADVLDRLARALQDPRVDGVLASPEILDDLALLGLLDDKIAVGSMNRGGLAGSSFEIDDRFTGHTVAGMVKDGVDFAKTLLRISYQDSATPSALSANAQAVNECAAAQLPIMLEPFISEWDNNTISNVLTPEAVISSIGISQALGTSSAYTWLKLPVVDDMERVMAATTLPTLLLGGERAADPEAAYARWESALALPGVRGLVVGRSLLYPADGDVEAAVATAAQMVHGSAAPTP